jgi:hypothetical protein
MSTSLQPSARSAHPTVIGEEGRRSLIDELRLRFLSIASRSKDPRVQEIRKMIARGDNRVAETTATILLDAHNSQREDPRSLGHTIAGFFSAHAKKALRKWKELRAAETRIEGKMNCTELELDQGDRSRVRILEMKAHIHEYREILDDEEAVLDAELYALEPRQ